uniref:Voltage-dependent anion-selective channel n=1 Tax=Hadrurus spadix TaxID=141984 RepID=A0A1W7RAX4_9SCOR
MAPPCFSDLGKQARDIFNKNYHFGLVKLECKTKTKSGVEFTVSGNSNNDTGRVSASLETKYKLTEHGIIMKEKWNTDNTLATEVSVEDLGLKGLKLAFDTTFAPLSGKKTGTLKTAFKNDCMHLNTDVDFDFAGPIVQSAAVVCYQGWHAGTQLGFDTGKNKLTRTSFALGYTAGDFMLNTHVNDGQEFGGTLSQIISGKLETAVQLSCTAGSNSTQFGLGCVYKLDCDTLLRAKVNKSGQIGLGFTHRLRDGIQLHLSTMIDGKNFNQGGHKLGLGLDLSA